MIEELVVLLSTDPHNPIINFELGLAYDSLGQTASAVSCYLRTAEFGYDSHPDYVYASLLQIAKCMESQRERQWSVSGALLQAIAYMPSRPEAWFFLARYHERKSEWQECFTYATVGKSVCNLHEHYRLPCTTEFPGSFVFDFEIAVSGWWLGRKDESLAIFNRLLTNERMPAEYISSCLTNMQSIGV